MLGTTPLGALVLGATGSAPTIPVTGGPTTPPHRPPTRPPQPRSGRTRPNTRIEILDASLNLITWVKSPYPIDNSHKILSYSKELSDFGQCRFRVSSYDTMFTTFGDILKPHANHIRIVRDGTTVWSGAIIENGRRTKDYVEIIAAEYEWYLSKVLIKRSSNNPANGQADGIYRIFNSGGIDAAVTAIMNETITTMKGTQGVHPLSNMTLGTIENPNYPPNLTNGATPPGALTGPWAFGNGTTAPQLTFDYHSVMYVLKSLANVTFADFGIDQSLVFSFKKFFGNKKPDVNFTWGKHGNVVDFNIPRLGQKMANDLLGIATDNNGLILHAEQTDQSSIAVNGLIQVVAAYADVKDQATLNARIQAELPLVSNPSDSPAMMVLNQQAYPLGFYDIGDIVNVNINHIFLTYAATKRVVGISVSLDDTGSELTTVQLNTPLPNQVGA